MTYILVMTEVAVMLSGSVVVVVLYSRLISTSPQVHVMEGNLSLGNCCPWLDLWSFRHAN